jgi:hypothetical protein
MRMKCYNLLFCILGAPPILRISLLRVKKCNSQIRRFGYFESEALSSPKRTIHTVALAIIPSNDQIQTKLNSYTSSNNCNTLLQSFSFHSLYRYHQ